MDKSGIKKILDKINKRITRAEKAFDMDEETKKVWRGQLKDLVPNTDMLTRGGLLSLSDESVSLIDEMTLEVLENNLPNTVKNLRAEAEERIDDILQSTEDEDKLSLINAEVVNKIKVNSILDNAEAEQNISDLIKEMQNIMNNIDPMLEIENNELYNKLQEVNAFLYSSGKYSYSDMYYMINDFEEAINEYNIYLSRRSN